MNIPFFVQHGMQYGLVLSLLLGAVTLGSLYWDAEIWLEDYPPDIRKAHGPTSDRAKRRKGPIGLCFIGALLGTVACSVWRLNQVIGAAPIVVGAFVTTFVTVELFNLFDLLVLDWLVFCTWQPRFLILPGTEGMAGYGDLGFHLKGFGKGTLLSLILSLIVAGLSTLLPAVPPDAMAHLRAHQQRIDLASGDPSFSLLDEAARDAAVIFLGESHGVATNEEMDLALLTHLHETAGVRVYIAEAGYSVGRFLDEYVQTGDSDLLNKVFRSLEGTTAWSSARVRFWERVHAWNQSLPEAERIRVVGLDVEHQYPIGVWHLTTLLPESPPAEMEEAVTTLRAMVEENRWSGNKAIAAVDAMSQTMENKPDLAETYLGNDLVEVARVLRSLRAGFAYYATDDDHEADVARDRYMADTYLALGLDEQTAYGKWGTEHVYQARYRDIDHIAALLANDDSPVSGRVVSIASVYADSTRLSRRKGAYATGRLNSPARIRRPLVRAADGEITLFSIKAPNSPFAEGLYLVEHPTAGGDTTDYVQFILLYRGATAAEPLENAE